MRPAVPATRLGRGIRMAQHAFTAAGVLALGYCLIVFLEAALFQSREAREFAQQLGTGRPASPAFAVHVGAGGVLGQLEIPRLGVSVMVVEGVDQEDLRRAAGHLPGTALPWQTGNVAIAAHRDTFFRPLCGIRKNDAVTLRTLRGAYRYRVVSTSVVRPEDTRVLNAGTRDSLTLVTCFPFHYVGAAPMRFIVRAERVEAAPSGS
ncbi:MAG TPA: class D sortase [Bryobacteraceae bacterium]|nr:class D sortase [Bryobacteraceae bacterium]